MQYFPNVCLVAVITVQYVLLYGLYEYIREVDIKCSSLEAVTSHRPRRDVNIAENSVSSKTDGGGEKVEFINPNFRPIIEKETNAKGESPNGTKEEWYWLNAYSRIPVRDRESERVHIAHTIRKIHSAYGYYYKYYTNV